MNWAQSERRARFAVPDCLPWARTKMTENSNQSYCWMVGAPAQSFQFATHAPALSGPSGGSPLRAGLSHGRPPPPRLTS